jgi:hypothetical protein
MSKEEELEEMIKGPDFKNMVRLYSVLLKVDMRNNPERYKNPPEETGDE